MLTKALYTGISEKFLIFLFVMSKLLPTASWHNRSLPANPVSDGLAGFFGYIL